MIPRLKPYLGWEEIAAPFGKKRTVASFEDAFADQFQAKNALAFPYGRSALWAFFKALGIENAEVVQPAYTCSVVAHATVLSGNIPVFVDCTLDDYNMDLAHLSNAITPQTRAVIPTHIFGTPMDVDAVNQVVAQAEKKFGHKIWVIQDCAHSFGAEWEGRSVIQAGDGALFGLGISKLITSIFGGMFTTRDSSLAQKLHAYREKHFNQSRWAKSLRRDLYLLAVYPAFAAPFYGLVYWLQERTPALDGLTRAYHLDEKIHFPPDYLDQMTSVEAAVGLVQLAKYDQIIQRRRTTAEQFFTLDQGNPDFIFPAKIAGATYSHFAIRTMKKRKAMEFFAAHGIQLGELIEYSMPYHPAYRQYTRGVEFPNALLCSRSMINLPIHPGLSQNQIQKILFTFKDFLSRLSEP